MPKKAPDPSADIARIRKKLKHYVDEPPAPAWLDAGDRALNGALGSAELGIPFGRILELYGPTSHGKTMLALHLARRAQEAGAAVVWLDLENSYDDGWAARQGIDATRVHVLRVQTGRFGKATGDSRLQSAEELFLEAEELVKLLHGRDDDWRGLVVVDSVAAILVEDEAKAGVADQNMRTSLSLARFLGPLLRRWAALCLNYRATMVCINQIRENPSAMFGNPEYTPGGRSLPFYASIRAEVRRVKQGRLVSLGKLVGLRGRIKNVKNKAGGDSVEGLDCGYVTRFDSGSWKFPPVKEVGKDSIMDQEDATVTVDDSEESEG